MATIKLGMLVSEIAGSIGGTTFRRGNNFVAMQNKTKGPAKSITLINPALPQLAEISRLWSTLDSPTLTAWNEAAVLFPFADKFGAIKYLSGRELFIKLVNANFNAGLSIPNPNFLTSVVTEITAIEARIETNGIVVVEFTPGAAGTLVAFQCELLRNQFSAPAYTRRRITALLEIDNVNTIIFTNQFFAQIPNPLPGQVFRIFYTPQNEYGFKGLPQFINATAEEI